MNLPELSKAISELPAKIAALINGGRINAEQAEAFKAEVEILKTSITNLQTVTTELATVKAENTKLIADISDLTAKAGNHAAELDSKEKDVEARASAKAAAIAAGQGIKPVETKPADPISGKGPNSIDDLNKQMANEKDPTKKWAIFQQVKKLRGL